MKSGGKLYQPAALLLAILVLVISGACTAPADPPEADGTDESITENDHGHEEEASRIRNNGAVIRIVSPADGASFAAGDDIVVEISIENFTLNEEGSHWHVYVDSVSYGMVVGETTTQVLRGLEPGEYTIGAYLANGDHEEFEDGSEVTVTVSE